MNISPLLIYDLITFFAIFLLTISSLDSAWVNLIHKKISKMGFDAFILLFLGKRKATMIRKDPRIIKQIGIITLLVGVGGLNETIPFFIQRIWPYFH